MNKNVTLNKKNKDAGLIPKGKKASFMANLRIDSKKGTNDNATPERSNIIIKENLGSSIRSLSDSSVIYLDPLPSTRSI